MNLFSKSIISLTAIFLCSCNEHYEEHLYIDDNNQKIFFRDNLDSNGKDKFYFIKGHNDWNGEGAKIVIKGHFNKDSVDAAVEKYFDFGIYPSPQDLK